MMKPLILYRVLNHGRYCGLTASDTVLDCLKYHGIEVVKGTRPDLIELENYIVRLVVIPLGDRNMRYVRGMKASGCVNFDNEASKYITSGHNICEGMNLVEFLVSNAEGGEK